MAPVLIHNTFGFRVTSRYYIEYRSEEELAAFVRVGIRPPVLHVGGGSNLLFLADWPGTVLHSAIAGCRVLEESEEEILLEAGAGITLDSLIKWTLSQGYYGLENLSLIPGEVGGCIVQNVGAYGAEIGQRVERVRYISLLTGNAVPKELAAADCAFGYRTSIFKQGGVSRYAITRVTFRLSKTFRPQLRYGALADRFAALPPEARTAETLRALVIEMRRQKLPAPEEIGSAGSFFCNPVVSASHYARLKAFDAALPGYPQPNDKVKVPAAYLIEQCGWKGRTIGRAGVWERQPLVLVNRGGATAGEVRQLAEAIVVDVEQRYGIRLTPEVIYIGDTR